MQLQQSSCRPAVTPEQQCPDSCVDKLLRNTVTMCAWVQAPGAFEDCMAIDAVSRNISQRIQTLCRT